MLSTIFATTALLAASVVAQSNEGQGSAVIINKCKYDVHLSNVPAAGAGFDIINKVLAPEDTYSQQYVPNPNGGWAIKLSQTDDFPGDNILQYEYSWFPNDATFSEIVWYDMSAVNGNPWDGNWEIFSDDASTCAPRQAAYRYATDDAYGMQSCPFQSTITLVLCSGEEQADDVVSAISVGDAPTAAAVSSAQPTTLATSTRAATSEVETITSVAPVATITSAPVAGSTVVETAVVTQVYTRYRHRGGRGGN